MLLKVGLLWALAGLVQAVRFRCVKTSGSLDPVYFLGEKLAVCPQNASETFTFSNTTCAMTVQGKCVYDPLVRTALWTSALEASTKEPALVNRTAFVRREEAISCNLIAFRQSSDLMSFSIIDAISLCPQNPTADFFASVNGRNYAGNEQFCQNYEVCSTAAPGCYCVSQYRFLYSYDESIGSDDPLSLGNFVQFTLGVRSTQIDTDPLFPLEENEQGSVLSQFSGRIISIVNTRTKRDSDLRAWLFADHVPYLVKIENNRIIVPDGVVAQYLYLSVTVLGGSDYHHYNRLKNTSFDYADVSVKIPDDSVQVPFVEVVAEKTDVALIVAASVLFGILVILLLPTDVGFRFSKMGRIAKVSALILAAQGVVGCSDPRMIPANEIQSCPSRLGGDRVCGAKINTRIILASPGFEACLRFNASVTSKVTNSAKSLILPVSVSISYERLERVLIWEKKYETRNWRAETETVWACGGGDNGKWGCNERTVNDWVEQSNTNAHWFEESSDAPQGFKKTELNAKTGGKLIQKFLDVCNPFTPSCLFGRYAILPEGDVYNVLEYQRTEFRVHIRYNVTWDGNKTESNTFTSLDKDPQISGDSIKFKIKFNGKFAGSEVSFAGQRLVQKDSDSSVAYMLPADVVSSANSPRRDSIGDIQASKEGNWDSFNGFKFAPNLVFETGNKDYQFQWAKAASGLNHILSDRSETKLPSSFAQMVLAPRRDVPGELYSYDPDGSAIDINFSVQSNNLDYIKFEEIIDSVKPVAEFVKLQGNVGNCRNGAEVVIKAGSDLDDGPVLLRLSTTVEGDTTGITLVDQYLELKKERQEMTIRFRSLKQSSLSFGIDLVGEDYETAVKVSGQLTECEPKLVNKNDTYEKPPPTKNGGGGILDAIRDFFEQVAEFFKKNLSWLIPVLVIGLALIIGLPLILTLVPNLFSSIGNKVKKN
jgi:hypothetical protein